MPGTETRRPATTLEGYLRQAEEAVDAGLYAAAYAVYSRGIMAFVLPDEPDAVARIHARYARWLEADPASLPALRSAGFAHWAVSEYRDAIAALDRVLEVRPDDGFATLFRGSSRLLGDVDVGLGAADLERAIALDPRSPDVRYVVADAYTYGVADPARALAEAIRALAGGLDTPRVHAILASAHAAAGDLSTAATHFAHHVDLVTTDLRAAPPLHRAASLSFELVPGRVYEVPVPALAGERIAVETGSRDIADSIAVLLAPDGMPVAGGDDELGSFAAIDWLASETATYRLRVTSFEASEAGTLEVNRR